MPLRPTPRVAVAKTRPTCTLQACFKGRQRRRRLVRDPVRFFRGLWWWARGCECTRQDPTEHGPGPGSATRSCSAQGRLVAQAVSLEVDAYGRPLHSLLFCPTSAKPRRARVRAKRVPAKRAAGGASAAAGNLGCRGDRFRTPAVQRCSSVDACWQG